HRRPDRAHASAHARATRARFGRPRFPRGARTSRSTGRARPDRRAARGNEVIDLDDLDLSSWLVVAAVVVTLAGGLVSLSRPRRAATLLVLGCIAAIGGGVLALAGWTSTLDAPWEVPGGRLSLGVDAVSAMFVLPIALVSALGSIYAVGYWA